MGMPLLTHGTDTMAVDTVMDMDLDTTDTDTVDTTVTPTDTTDTDTSWARGPLMPNPRPMPLLMLGMDITDTDTVMAVTTVRKLATKHCYFLPTLLIDQPPFFKLELPSQLSTDLHPVFIKRKKIFWTNFYFCIMICPTIKKVSCLYCSDYDIQQSM